jgi:hypothetical protein
LVWKAVVTSVGLVMIISRPTTKTLAAVAVAMLPRAMTPTIS